MVFCYVGALYGYVNRVEGSRAASRVGSENQVEMLRVKGQHLVGLTAKEKKFERDNM